MGFLKKLNSWRKKTTNTPTKVDACLSTEDPRTSDAATEIEVPRTSDAATEIMDPPVTCAVYTQTEEKKMDDDGAAAKPEDDDGAAAKPEINTQIIRELEKELVFAKRFTADLMFGINSVEQEARKYAETPVIVWSDECECRKNVSAVADLLKNFIITKDAEKLKQESRDTKKSNLDATSGRTTTVDHETQTELNSSQRDYASVDEQEDVRKLEDQNRILSELVEDYKRKIVVLNEDMESILRDRTSHIQHIKMRSEEELQCQLLKMRDMRDELLWYKERFPDFRMPIGRDC